MGHRMKNPYPPNPLKTLHALGVFRRTTALAIAFTLLAVHLLILNDGGAEAAPAPYVDRFNTQAYDNSAGTLDWSGSPWVEINDDGSAAYDLLADSFVGIEKGELVISVDPEKRRGLKRSVDLSQVDAAVLVLMVEASEVADNAALRIDIQPAGGDWSRLITIDKPTEERVSLDIDDYASPATTIRITAVGETPGTKFTIDERGYWVSHWNDPKKLG